MGSRDTLKLWRQYLLMDLDVRAREEVCLDLLAQMSTTTYCHGMHRRRGTSGDEKSKSLVQHANFVMLVRH